MRQSLWPSVIACVIVIGLAVAIGLQRPWQAAAPAGAPVPQDLVVSDAGTRMVTLTFHTAVASRWTARSSTGASVTETAEVRMHALSLPVEPWSAPDALELSCGTRTVAVTPPPGPRARVRRLVTAARAARLDLAATDQVYETIRKSFRDWSVMDPITSTAAKAAREIADRPELAGPLMELISRSREAIEALAPVRGLVLEALTDPATPAAVQDELMEALGRLDHVDALAAYYGQPPPARVQELLRPVFQMTLKSLPSRPKPKADGERMPLPLVPPTPDACLLFEPAKLSEGNAVFIPEEDVTQAGAGITSVLMIQRVPGLTHVDPCSELKLKPCVAPGKRGHRLLLRVGSLPMGLYLWLKCGRLANGFPLRLEAAQDAGILAEHEVSVRIPNALQAPGRDWTLSQRRLMKTASRTYYVVRRAELLPD